MPTSIRLSEDVEGKLDRIARETGRSKAFYIRKIIETHIDEIIDHYRVDRAMKDLKSGKAKVYSQDEVEELLGVR